LVRPVGVGHDWNQVTTRTHSDRLAKASVGRGNRKPFAHGAQPIVALSAIHATIRWWGHREQRAPLASAEPADQTIEVSRLERSVLHDGPCHDRDRDR